MAEMTGEERRKKREQLAGWERFAEQAYDDMYEKAHSPTQAAAYYSDTKDALREAAGLARELGLEADAIRLEKRLEHITAVFRSQFSS